MNKILDRNSRTVPLLQNPKGGFSCVGNQISMKKGAGLQ